MAIEEELEEMVLQAHLAKADLRGEESYELLMAIGYSAVTVNCSLLSIHHFLEPHSPPQSSAALSLAHHHRPSYANCSSFVPSLPWIDSPA